MPVNFDELTDDAIAHGELLTDALPFGRWQSEAFLYPDGDTQVVSIGWPGDAVCDVPQPPRSAQSPEAESIGWMYARFIEWWGNHARNVLRRLRAAEAERDRLAAELAEAQQIRLVSLSDDVVIGEADLAQLREIAAREGYPDAGGLLTYLLHVEKHSDALGQSVCGMIAARPTPEQVAERLWDLFNDRFDAGVTMNKQFTMDCPSPDEFIAAVRDALENTDGP